MIRNLFLGSCGLGLLTAGASAAVQGLLVEGSLVFTSGGPLSVIKLSATFSDPGDRVTGVSASEFIANWSFHQHLFGTDTEPLNPLLALDPELAHDTFVTVGQTSTHLPPSGTPTTLAPGAAFSASSFTGGWSTTSAGAHTQAGADGKVLLGQFTFAGLPPDRSKVSTSLVLNWQASDGEPHSTHLEYKCMGVLTPILCPTLTAEIDANDDCVVNGLDLAIFLGQWGSRCPSVFVAECAGDFNNDLVVNGLDLAILLGRWGPVPVCPPR